MFSATVQWMSLYFYCQNIIRRILRVVALLVIKRTAMWQKIWRILVNKMNIAFLFSVSVQWMSIYFYFQNIIRRILKTVNLGYKNWCSIFFTKIVRSLYCIGISLCWSSFQKVDLKKGDWQQQVLANSHDIWLITGWTLHGYKHCT